MLAPFALLVGLAAAGGLRYSEGEPWASVEGEGAVEESFPPEGPSDGLAPEPRGVGSFLLPASSTQMPDIIALFEIASNLTSIVPCSDDAIFSNRTVCAVLHPTDWKTATVFDSDATATLNKRIFETHAPS